MAADLLPCAWCQRLPTVTEGEDGFHLIACNNRDCGVWPRVIMSSLDGALRQWNKRAPPLAAPATTTGTVVGDGTIRLTLDEARTLVRAQADEAERRRTEAFIAANATPPAAPAAVTEAMVDAWFQAWKHEPSAIYTADGQRRLLQAALAAAAKAGMGE